jgi:metal-responsive CopG/Arc/MetJ family transcriptional regulator
MRLTVSIPEEVGQALREAAAREGVSVSRLAKDALSSYLRRQQRLEAGSRLLELAGHAHVADDALEQLESGRADDRS